jgi:hypothetical protein
MRKSERKKMERIVIKTIPHNKQRYETVGDYYPTKSGWQFNISDMGNADYEFAVAIHELIEHHLAHRKGVTNKEIDDFDMQYEQDRLAHIHGQKDEPGDDPKCPVYEEHKFATKIERMLIKTMGYDWTKYDKAVMEL